MLLIDAGSEVYLFKVFLRNVPDLHVFLKLCEFIFWGGFPKFISAQGENE